MKNQVAKNQLERISLNKTIYESAIGRNLVEATQNLLKDQAYAFDGVARFEILSARRISASRPVLTSGHETELWEVWEFEIFTHPEGM